MGVEIIYVQMSTEDSDKLEKEFPNYKDVDSTDAEKVWELLDNDPKDPNAQPRIFRSELFCGRGGWMHCTARDLGLLSQWYIMPLTPGQIESLRHEARKTLAEFNDYQQRLVKKCDILKHNMSQLSLQKVELLLETAKKNGDEYIDLGLLTYSSEENEEDDFVDYVDDWAMYAAKNVIENIVNEPGKTWWSIYSY